MMKTGEPGSTVNITILRDGEIIDYTVRRDIVELPDLEYEMLEEDIGYIWLYNFDGAAAKNFKNAIDDLKKKGMKGLVLDLRGNGGGLLEVCREIADMLLPEGLVVYSESRSGKRTEYKSDREELGMPLVVLVNEYSASASEVLAGAVQGLWRRYHHRHYNLWERCSSNHEALQRWWCFKINHIQVFYS